MDTGEIWLKESGAHRFYRSGKDSALCELDSTIIQEKEGKMEARNLIITADRIAHGQGLNQKQWSEKSGHAKNGQTVSRIINKGDCRLSTFLELLKPLGYRLEIKEDGGAKE
jgi:hypothetical protein